MKHKVKKKHTKKLLTLILILSFILLSSSIYIKINYNKSIISYLFETTTDKLVKQGYTKEDANIIINNLNDNTINELLKINYNKNIVLLIKENNFKEDNLFIYLEELNKSNLGIKSTIFIVNHKDYSKNIIYDNKIIEILNEPFYLSKNLNRYTTYREKTLTSKEIVSLINTNRDYDYYTNIKKTNTDMPYQMLVNKYYYLDKNYKLELITQEAKYGKANVKLEKETYEHFKKMFEAAKKENLTLYVNSAYRSYEEQKSVFDYYEKIMGPEVLEYAAKPGHSEHQTGLALDIFKPGTTTKTFEKTKEFKWLQQHAHKYGFILRYPKGKENITGYDYESWHYRYVGEEIATYIWKNNITFDEYYAFFIE